MKIDASMLVADPGEAGAFSKELESKGFDGVYTFEGQHDPFMPLAIAAQHTSSLELITGIAVAFGRSPLTLAHLGYDLQLTSKGRFIMGLGSQVKAHIERRYNMPWSKPAARMRDMIKAIHAIWDSWETGERLNYQGEFYQHTLMIPTFNPGPNPYGKPKIFLGGIGPLMTQVAGEVADGYFIHPFHTPQFIEQVSMPALKKGFSLSNKKRQNFQISCQVILASGFNKEEIQAAKEAARNQIAFYASTPAYLSVLENFDCPEIHSELHTLSREGKWAEMARLISDDLLEAVAVTGTPEEVAEKIIVTRSHINRISPVAYNTDTKLFNAVLTELKKLSH